QQVDPGDSLFINSFSQPAHGGVGLNGQSLEYTPDHNYCGPDSYTYNVHDNANNISNMATVTITVNCVNDPPIGNDDVAAGSPGAWINNIDVLANDVDPDGDGLFIVSVGPVSPSGPLVTIAPGGQSINFYSAVAGTFTFPYTVCDAPDADPEDDSHCDSAEV